VNEELRRRKLPGHDDHDLERELRDEPLEARKESTLAEARWILAVALSLPLVAGVVAFRGLGTVSKALRTGVLGALKQVRDSSTAALRSAVGESSSKHLPNGSHEPCQEQYHSSAFICLPNVQEHHGHVVDYATSSVPARSVPSLVSSGAIYPVPASSGS
jgi:hypothetical protein